YLVDVLPGIRTNIENDAKKSSSTESLRKGVTIKSLEQTNALILTGAPDVVRVLDNVISLLDIRRPQVMVEAILAVVQ
ncbi:secretin N-terminal domain-containing protein, partial [Escherichia coli]